MKRILCSVLATVCACVLLIPHPALMAQIGTEGSILGVVTDPSGAVIGGAEVTVTNLSTGLKKTAQTEGSGNFEILQLPRGPYSVSVSFAGFKTWTVERTELTVGQRLRVSPVLEIGEITDKVTVEATAQLVQTDKGSVEMVVEEKAIRELPLNGRNPIALVGLVPGMRYQGISGIHRSSTVQGLGQRNDQTDFQLDGLTATETSDKTGIGFPSVETIAEFNVETANFSAELGSAPLQVVLVTKTGTNAFHGSAWDFIRNDKLDARNAFALTKPKLRQNQFGYTVGGPIIKNRTFFFWSYEGTRIRQERVFNSVTPRAEMFNGDFSAKPIRDPLTGQPFPGNIIPANRISSASKFFYPYILQPNSGTGTFRGVAPSPDDMGIYSLRIDEQLTSNQRLSGRVIINREQVSPPGYSPTVILDRALLQHNTALNYTWNLNPTTLLTAGLGYNRSRVIYSSNVTGIENLNVQAGINGFPTKGREGSTGLPSVTLAGYTGFSSPSNDPGQQKIWGENYKVGMNLVRGAHSLSYGYQFADGHTSVYHASCCSRGTFTFNGQYTGDGFADYLLGLVQTSSRNFPLNGLGVANSPYSALYLQDFWKLSSNLTINLGVRYDYWHEKAFLRGTGSTFDLSLGKSIAGENKNGQVDLTSQAVSPYLAEATKGMWISATEAGQPPGLFKARGIFTPRLGIAWRPSGSNDLVVRGGYGLFPSIFRDNITGSSIIGPPYWTFETQAWSASQLQRWEDAWPNDPKAFLAPSVTAARPDLPNIKNHQWNISIQKTLPAESAITVSYVGNKTTDLLTQVFHNVARPGLHTNLQADKPFPAWGDINLYEDVGFTNYNALQVKFERRFSGGLAYQLSYSFGKHLEEGGATWTDANEPYSPEGYNYGRSQLDRTHLLAANAVYEVPIGKGRKYLSDLHPVANAVVGGWQFSSIYSFNSGEPLTFIVPGATLGNGRNTRPNLGPDLKVSDQTADRWFNPAALTAPALYTFGNSGLSILDSPGIHLWDTSLSKNFYFRETKYLQFRWEMFNAPNHVNLAQPGTTINQGATARILSTSTPARSMQFALKFVF